MSETEWTPGNWAFDDEPYSCSPNAIRAGKTLIAHAIGDSAEADANAHLIAAAPELYGALQAARAQLRTLGTPDDSVNNHIIGLCDASLAKARGETP